MTLRPPRPSGPRDIWKDSPAAALDYELAQEKAATLGRLGRALEAALRTLAEFDRLHPRETAPAAGRAARARLVADAGRVLWHLVIQREALGLRDSPQLMRDYGVPPEVRASMGVVTAAVPNTLD